MTSNQRDILAGVLTAVYLWDGDGVSYEQWIDTYMYYRNKINEWLDKENE